MSHTRTYYLVFIALLVLLAATVGVAQFHLGPAGFFAAASIAGVKALLILLFFMHVRDSKPLIWLFAAAGFFWLAILLGLTFSDYLTRQVTSVPGLP
jgi:cytochrome c oxidase subunit 4